MIINNNDYLLRIQPEMMQMLIIFNKDQMNVIEYGYLRDTTTWFHLIIS